MPRKPSTPCRYPGCGQVTETPFCDFHQKHERKREFASRSQDRSRFDSRWRKIREVVLKEEPYCRLCSAPSSHVDHIDGDYKNESRSNFQALCGPCHSSKTNRQDGGFGNPKRSSDG